MPSNWEFKQKYDYAHEQMPFAEATHCRLNWVNYGLRFIFGGWCYFDGILTR